MRRALWLVVLFLASPAFAATYYVQTNGSDSTCDGSTTDAAGVDGTCAKRTISAAVNLAGCGCGCAVQVGAGDFFENASVNLQTSGCSSPAPNPKLVNGTGVGTRVFFNLAGPASCTAVGDSTYTCPAPTGASAGSTNTIPAQLAAIQFLDTSEVVLEMLAGKYTTAAYALAIAPVNGTSATGSVDGDDNGTFESNLNQAAGTGMYFRAEAGGVGTGNYIVHPWVAITSSTPVYIPTGTGLPEGFNMTQPYMQIANMNVLMAGSNGSGSGNKANCFHVSGASADDNSATNINCYNGGIQIGNDGVTPSNPDRFTALNIGVFNNFQRFRGLGCGVYGRNQCDNPDYYGRSTDPCRLHGYGSSYTNVHCYIGNNGASFAGRNNTYDRIKAHGFINHGFGGGALMDSTFSNSLSYNNQESWFWNTCSKNLTFKHVTMDGTVFYTGNAWLDSSLANKLCPDGTNVGQVNVDIYNSLISKLSMRGTSPQSACPGGSYCGDQDPRDGTPDLDTDFNIYWGDSGTLVEHYIGDTFPSNGTRVLNATTIAAWETYATDTCTSGCARETNGAALVCAGGANAGKACHSGTGCPSSTCSVDIAPSDLFVNPSGSDANIPPGCTPGSTCTTTVADYHLKSTAPARNFGNTTYAVSVDMDGTVRDTASPDNGAYEFAGVSAVCINNIREGSEVCDGTDLDGQTCQSQNPIYDGGTLACNGTCTAFVTTACTDCGNNDQEGAEVCDGTDLSGNTCLTIPGGFTGGSPLLCQAGCSAYNTSNCTGADSVDPAPIDDLVVGTPHPTECPLTWHDTGDDGESGNFTAGSVTLIRYLAGGAQTAAGFNSATPVPAVSVPTDAGRARNHPIRNLTPNTTYTIYILDRDEVGNPISLDNADLDYATCVTADDNPPVTNPETVTGADVVGGGVQ